MESVLKVVTVAEETSVAIAHAALDTVEEADSKRTVSASLTWTDAKETKKETLFPEPTSSVALTNQEKVQLRTPTTSTSRDQTRHTPASTEVAVASTEGGVESSEVAVASSEAVAEVDAAEATNRAGKSQLTWLPTKKSFASK